MSARTISIGLGGKNLKDKDVIGVSDPYVTISRPNPSGGFQKIRTSETKMVDLQKLSCIDICKLNRYLDISIKIFNILSEHFKPKLE